MQNARLRRICSTRGGSTLEFTLCAIPLIFVLISLVSMSLAMWNYHTLAEAVKATARAASVHGAGCVGKSCAWTAGTAAGLLATVAIGIPAGSLNVTFTAAGGTVLCSPLTSCANNMTAWPTSSASAAGTTDVTVAATYTPPMFARMQSLGFSAVTFGASSTQLVLY
jgi:Flp pilus assembly protein TadG